MSMQLCELKTSQIRTSGDNPRIINPKSSEFAELVESIRSLGVKVPIHVREKGKNYELLAGERRLLAAKAAGLDTIPALNHGELTDEAAFEVTFAENFARQDLTVLEQGKAIWLLLIKYKGDVPAVASKMGKPEQWVRLLEAINSNLSEKWKKMVLEDTDYQYFTASHLGLIARFPQHIQDGEIIKSLEYHGQFTVRELEKHLAEFFRILKKAPFDNGECVNCEKRSSHQPTLWAEKAEEVSGAKDRCLDAACWRGKEIAEGKKKFAEVKKKHAGLICVSDEQPDDITKKIYGRILRGWEYTKGKEGGKGAVPALVVDGKGSGKIIFVKPTPQQGQSQNSTKPKPQTTDQMREELERRRWNRVFEEFYESAKDLTIKDLKCENALFAVMLIAISTDSEMHSGGLNVEEFVSDALTQLQKNKAKAEDILAARILEMIREDLQYGIVTDGTPESIEDNKAIAALFGIDLDMKYKKVCERDEFKEPAEWANLKADGTSNVAKAKKAKK